MIEQLFEVQNIFHFTPFHLFSPCHNKSMDEPKAVTNGYFPFRLTDSFN